MNINGEYGLLGDSLSSIDSTAKIELSNNEINLEATNVLVNGAPIGSGGGFVTNPVSANLDANEYSINNAGSVTAAVFIKNGGTNQQYLMADGSSLQYSQNSGNSNFYLYDNGVDQNPTPPNGVVTYNTVEQKQATEIYISHRTRDNIDIEVFFNNISTLNTVYLQDQSNSDNNITYDITGPPVIVNQAQITIPVAQTSSNGTGSTTFGVGHNILVSFFTNSIETDLRITALEGKTQNINASLIGTDFSNNSSFILDPASSHTFTIRNNATPFSTAKFSVNNTSVQIISVPLLMNLQRITLLAAPIDPNDATRKVYVDDADALKLNLTGGNITGNLTVAGNLVTRLGTFDVFNITNNTVPSSARFTLSNTNATMYVTMSMNNNILNGITTPASNDDATNKLYVDTRDALKLDKAPTLIQQGGLKWAKVNAAVTQGNAVGTFDLIGTPLSTAIVGSTTFAANEITPFSTYVITIGGRITLPSNSGCSVSVTMNGVLMDSISFGNNPNLTGGGFECKYTWTFRAGGVFSSSIMHNIGGGTQNTTANQGGGGSVSINTAIVQVMGVQFASPTFTSPNITTYTITCVKL